KNPGDPQNEEIQCDENRKAGSRPDLFDCEAEKSDTNVAYQHQSNVVEEECHKISPMVAPPAHDGTGLGGQSGAFEGIKVLPAFVRACEVGRPAIDPRTGSRSVGS